MLNPRRDTAFLELGAETGGAVHLGACTAAGLPNHRLEWLVASGRWQLVYPRVYVTFSGPIPLATREHAALLYAGDGALLSHESAGADYGISRQPGLIHVLVPYAREVEDQPGLKIHRSRTISDDDIDKASSIPRTSIERTVLDLLRGMRTAEAALGLVADAVRTRRTTPDRIREALRQRPKTRWRKVVSEAMPDLRAGAQSPLELRDAAIRRAHGLPMGKRQKRRLVDGTEYLDVWIEEWGLHIETDGRLGHDRARETWRDMRRDNRTEVAQKRGLRYGWADMVDRPCDVAAQQAEVLLQQGWPGPFKRCPRCPS